MPKKSRDFLCACEPAKHDKGEEEEEDDEDEGKHWVESARFSFNAGSMAVTRCPLFSICPADAKEGQELELDLLAPDDPPRPEPEPEPDGDESEQDAELGPQPGGDA